MNRLHHPIELIAAIPAPSSCFPAAVFLFQLLGQGCMYLNGPRSESLPNLLICALGDFDGVPYQSLFCTNKIINLRVLVLQPTTAILTCLISRCLTGPFCFLPRRNESIACGAASQDGSSGFLISRAFSPAYTLLQMSTLGFTGTCAFQPLIGVPCLLLSMRVSAFVD